MSALSRVPTFSVVLGLTGRRAIDAVARDLAGDGVSLTLHRFADASGEREDDIDIARAEEIHRIDPGLVYLGAEIVFYTSNVEICAFCGKLGGAVWSHRFGWTASPIVEATPGPALEIAAPSTLGDRLLRAADNARNALTQYLRDALEDA